MRMGIEVSPPVGPRPGRRMKVLEERDSRRGILDDVELLS